MTRQVKGKPTIQSVIELPAAFDAHLHLRQGDLMKAVALESAWQCDRVLVMPNTKPPIVSYNDIMSYRDQCQEALGPGVAVLVTAKLTNSTTPKDVKAAIQAQAVGYKLYPEGVTTNSGDGVPGEEFMEGELGFTGKVSQRLQDVFGDMEDGNMVLCHHGEAPGFDCLCREAVYTPFVKWIAHYYPKLRQVVEHVTSERGVEMVRALAKDGKPVAGSITLQHLVCTIDDVLIGSDRVGVRGGKLRPHNHCLPVPKQEDDRKSLVLAALSGESCFFAGSDSAAHPAGDKINACGCAGVWSMPVWLPSLVSFFLQEWPDNRWWNTSAGVHEAECLAKLEAFISGNGAAFYGDVAKPSGRTVSLAKTTWQVPAHVSRCGEVLVPFRAGERLTWQLQRNDGDGYIPGSFEKSQCSGESLIKGFVGVGPNCP